MNPKYPRRGSRKKRLIILAVVTVIGIVVGAAGLVVFTDLQQNSTTAVQGASREVAQAVGPDNKKLMVNEPLFSLELPGDWKEQSRSNISVNHSITWQATKKNQDNRSLQVYIDTIPTAQAVNKLLPVTPQGDRLALGDMSENCANFTSGGSLEVTKAAQSNVKPAKWAGAEFICDLPNTIDNKIGVGSSSGLNQVVLTGSKGQHKYFFLYIDRNIQPDYTILKDALQSFRTK